MPPQDPRRGTPNSSPFAYLNQIQDRAVRDALRQVMTTQGEIQQALSDLGRVTKPLSQILNAGGNQLKRLMDPTDPQDAVTLAFLQSYVANFASQFPGAAGEAGGGEGGETPPPAPDDNIPDHGGTVTAIWNAFTPPIGPASPEVDLYRFCQQVAQALETVDAPLTCGLLYKPSGANIYTCSGETYSISRICYDNGHIFKILVDADPGGARTPTWADNGGVPVDDYRAVAASGSC